jgi:hypothetical protein
VVKRLSEILLRATAVLLVKARQSSASVVQSPRHTDTEMLRITHQ